MVENAGKTVRRSARSETAFHLSGRKKRMFPHPRVLLLVLLVWLCRPVETAARDQEPLYEADLLVVGGTESGCAAAVQAARMGVRRIVLVNDTWWLGGQFSSQALGAIDENRGPQGYGHGVPFPRSGMFAEVVQAIERLNLRKYGKARPGNTRVITTCRPRDAAEVFRRFVLPAVESGQLLILGPAEPVGVLLKENRTLVGVRFARLENVPGSKLPQSRMQRPPKRFVVRARVTIDASDWGDVIRLSGAEYDFGPDLRAKYGEPLAPELHDQYPPTDMNPLTYCIVLEESSGGKQIVPPPPGYQPGCYEQNPYPRTPKFLYTSRRLIDGRDPAVQHGDVVLLCYPLMDYPLDVLPSHVAQALEQTEPGASRKNIVQMDRRQRELIYQDAKRHSLGFLHFVQSRHARMPDQRYSLARLRLSREFDTPDHMPHKPYFRESLRLVAEYMMKQQDTTGAEGKAVHFAQAMFPDAVACWQFEYDFHPTGRRFLREGDRSGPWWGYLKPLRRWGPPYSGRSQFPARSLVPRKLGGLLGAQKNLGYSAVVASAVRLHDQSMAIGQAAGAVAAVALRRGRPLRRIAWQRHLLAEVWAGLCSRGPGRVPAVLWPFRDLEPEHPAFVAANQLAVRHILPMAPGQIDFRPDQPAEPQWVRQVLLRCRRVKQVEKLPPVPDQVRSRGQFVRWLWEQVARLPERPFPLPKRPGDADADGVPDRNDPLPFTPGQSSWSAGRLLPPP